jgi:hypothetical protein
VSNFSDKARAIIAAVAPALGTAIGGPFGALAGTVISKSLGVQGDDKSIEAALAAGNPETLLKLKQADNDFQAHMAELGISADKLVYDDKANARAREVATHDNTTAILAYAITAGFFGTLAYLLMCGKPAAGGDALLVMLGSLGTAWAGVVTYYYGSSVGSKDKTVALAAAAVR